MALISLLRVVGRRDTGAAQGVAGALSDQPRQYTSWNRFETARDLGKLKKRLTHTLERLAATAATAPGGVPANIREADEEDKEQAR